MTREAFFPAIYGVMTILMGPGSMFFHASLKRWGGWIDGVSMYLFMGYILVYNIVRYFNLSRTWWILLYLGVTVTMSALGWALHEQATLVFAGLGGATLLMQIIVADAEHLSTDGSGAWWFFFGLLGFASAFVVWRLAWTGAPLCVPTSVWQGHGLWHLLAAFVVFSVWKYFRAENVVVGTPEPMPPTMRVFAGIVFGGAFAFGFYYYACVTWLGASQRVAVIVAIVAGTIGAVYGAIAVGYRSYAFGIFALKGKTRWFLCFSRKLFSTLGFIIDVTWGLLTTAIALIVWLPVSLIAGASHTPSTDDHRSSGNLVFSKNPIGVKAITVGPVVTGKYMSHEVVHTWQARVFGPLWLPVYGLAYVINVICRILRGRVDGLYFDCYHRIVFEDHAYWGGETSGNGFKWGGLVLGFLMCLLYTLCVLAVVAGVFLDGPAWAAWTGGIVVLAYSYVRAWLDYDLGGTR
jgi:hypothetical protein